MRIRFISHPDLMKKCCQEIKFKKYLFPDFSCTSWGNVRIWTLRSYFMLCNF